jgi:tetratricopeptide (TPR) repeat protein
MKDVFVIQSDISQTVAEALKVKLLPTEKERVEKKPTNNMEAYDLYLKGLQTTPWVVWPSNKENIERAREYFERAVELDPNFALAYAHLESCYMEAFMYKGFDERAPKAEAAALKALQLDNNLAESHLAFADVKMHNYDFDGWEKEVKRAIELKPNHASAHLFLGIHYMLSGKFDEANIEMRKARELDPLSSTIRYFIRSLLYKSRQYDRALEEIAEEIKLHDHPQLHNLLAYIHLLRGDFEKALTETETALAASSPDERPFRISTLACIYAKTGRKEEAMKMLNELEELSKQNPIFYEDLATLHYCLGESDETLRIFEKAYDEHSELLPFSLIDPIYDGLRSDPRFIALRKKVGLSALANS